MYHSDYLSTTKIGFRWIESRSNLRNYQEGRVSCIKYGCGWWRKIHKKMKRFVSRKKFGKSEKKIIWWILFGFNFNFFFENSELLSRTSWERPTIEFFWGIICDRTEFGISSIRKMIFWNLSYHRTTDCKHACTMYVPRNHTLVINQHYKEHTIFEAYRFKYR